jgi:hypothetical protein
MNKYAGEQTLALNVHTSILSLYRPRRYPVERRISSNSSCGNIYISSFFSSFRL